ncbi:SDR family oxidoreductase [Nakamurella flavida]|uniref:SDR family oxidoreductase n=1 Tax=Nakamurella flavida TaxID=363630 RepID=A0A939C5W4_9ACTN|nr:SDR family oxidoreductase [Nakamurella flavida]MBM9477359.1 SDR family oxidoreductase [Nakamurella flavida]MDP9777291.1 NAD(P)-dependent dehydrogenase (short-subunit alcohol dehydrogenase family) [Nakamurella flavida]
MTGRFTDRVVVVSGAAGGIGRALVGRFAQEGAHVVATDRDEALLDAPAVRDHADRVRPVLADLTDPVAVASVLSAATAVTGRVDVLVNNAGHFGGSTLLDTTDTEWDWYLDVNLRTQFLMSRAFVGAMVGQEAVAGVRGRIVNTTSQLGITAPPAALGYTVAKAGVIALTRSIAVDYAGAGIVANAVAPGRIITGDHPGEADYLRDGTVDTATAYSLRRTPFPRLGAVTDVVGSVLFLAGDDCTFVSGAVLSVDGGWTAS